MKLNLHILEGELSPSFERSLTDGPSIFECSHPAPYRPGETFLSKPVYIAKAADLPAKPEAEGHPSLICIGKPPAAYLTSPFNTLWTEEDTTVDLLLDEALDAFDRYYEWELAMQRAIDGELPLREFGVLAQPFEHNPIYLQSMSLMCIFHVIECLDDLAPETYKQYCEYEGADSLPLIENSYLSLDSVNELISDPAYVEAVETEEPTIYSSDKFKFDTLYYNIKVRGEFYARLLFEGIEHGFTSRDFSLIKIVGDTLARAMKDKDIEDFNRPKDLDDVLGNLLRHHLVDESRITSILNSYRWDVHDTYCCTVLESKSFDRGQKILKTLALQLISQLPSNFYMVIDGRLVFVFNLTSLGYGQEDLLERALPVFRDNLLSAGISMTFDDFKNLYYYYQQSLCALDLGSKEDPEYWCFHYERYHLKDLMQRCRGKQIPEALIPKGLKALITYDKAKHTGYVPLLKSYIEHDRGVTETARATYMSRSTLLYRLNRIDEISHLDLDDSDVRLTLGIAFKLIEQ